MNRFILLLLTLTAAPAFAATWVSTEPAQGAFPLVAEGRAATWDLSPTADAVVRHAVEDVLADIRRVTGVRPDRSTTAIKTAQLRHLVMVGTLGQHPVIDQLVAEGRINVGDLAGAWESFVITTVEDPTPNVKQALVIVGSDRRGTAFGTYELAQAIGVSPWHWWADVAPEPREALYVAAGTRRFGPPSVKYRGIFINDEDWGLQPWAAHTFEPQTGDIGPKTYEKVFELLLRLKANTLWPAMHACTAPFNGDPRNAALADDYAIIMGSSHAEPMLRNNVREWTAPKPDYNYVNNREGVRAYWEERARTNGGFENIYTLGMRGIHDSGIQGTTDDAQRITVLEQVFADQRDLIARHVTPDVTAAPQMFCAYKEVLDLYRQGLQVPDDVTIVWPDDNFGYVRNFASPAERARAGGFGVYYHVSYLGRPLAYLWLNTTTPALIWAEMAKSYAHGADQIWILNVGDIKPAEIGTEFFLGMAWDIGRWNPDTLPDFLPSWATREFGAEHADAIADVMTEFYRLNSVRKPEHLQWWTPLKEDPKPSDLTPTAIDARLAAFAALRSETDRIAAALPAANQDAFFQLIGYPVHGAALANERYFAGERGDASAAHAADAALHELTAAFDTIADGKWRGFMRLEPADNDWRSMRIGKWQMPEFPAKPTAAPAIATIDLDLVDAARGPWRVVPGLGQSGRAVTLLPFDRPDPADLTFTFTVPAGVTGDWRLKLHRLPTHPIDPSVGQPVTITLNNGQSFTLDATTPDGSEAWKQSVLEQRITHTVDLGPLASGSHTLTLTAGAGLVIDELALVALP